MKATLFEFRNRRWFIIAIFLIGFGFYRVDHKEAGVEVARWLALHYWAISLHAWTRAAYGFATIVLVVSAALRSWGTAYLQTAVMQSRTVVTDRLLADGPFRHVRNPLYLGNLLMAVGIGLLASRAGFVFLIVAMVVFHYRLILREEAELSATQGESYRAYCARVPRLWFRILPRVPSTGNKAHWLNGILGEVFHWALALGALLYAYSLNIRIFWGVFVLSLLPGIWFRFREAGKPRQSQA
ncbi:MAG: isoprenylcysteine carboxylmethyltransferase family protein [Candidatus Acidiferrales bacterium]